MAMDVGALFDGCDELAARTPNERSRGMAGSAILGIAAEVGAMQARGIEVANFTVGDFAPSQFRIPKALEAGIGAALAEGATNYPPAIGIPELRSAIRRFYARELGLDYPPGSVQVGSGARPPIFAAFATILAPDDVLVYPVPSWNNGYYAYLNRAKAVPVETRPENGFLPTVDDLAPHLTTARMIALNSPLNPSGTALGEDQLRAICDAIVAENRRRAAVGDRPLILLYDQVYWQLTFGDVRHVTPVGLVPEMARYTILIDAVSKCWAATGVRIGWAVCPPWIRDRMKPLVGHMGAWAPRAEQLAAARILDDIDQIDGFRRRFTDGIQERLDTLYQGLTAMKSEGLPVDALAAQGAIYLTVRFDLLGRTLRGRHLATDDDVRRYILEEARVAVVPFTAFGLPRDSGWVRFSVGAVGVDDVRAAVDRIRTVLRRDLA